MSLPFQPSHPSLPFMRRDGDSWAVARVVGRHVDGLCMVAGLTSEGARLMSVLELAVGDEVMLDLGGETRRAARVRWVEGAVAGIGFDEPATVVEDDVPNEGVRQPPRFRRCVPVVLERHGREQAGELIDISQFGACIAAPPQPWLRLGSGVVLEIEGCDPVDAEVRWRQDGRIGLAFRSHVQLWKLDKHLSEWARSCAGCARADCEGHARGSLADRSGDTRAA